MVRTVDFNQLRDNAKKVETKNQRKVDERLYKLERNDDGNAFAVIRFLPQKEGEDTYYAMNYSHFFTENGKTFSELCPTVIGDPCPVCKYNAEHWKVDYGVEEKKRKRKVRYVTNILVIKDKEHPEREGQVFLYEYGEKIHKKICNMIYDNDEEGTKGYNVFDFMKGKNFKLKIKTVSDYPNYDDSEFIADASPIFEGNEKKINELDKKIYSLIEFVPTKEAVKSYSELELIFQSKINGVASSPSTTPKSERKEEVSQVPWTDSDPVNEKAKSKTVDQDDFFKIDVE